MTPTRDEIDAAMDDLEVMAQDHDPNKSTAKFLRKVREMLRALRDQREALTGERYYAVRDAAKAETTEAYFNARPYTDTKNTRDVFDAGFDRGFYAAAMSAQGGEMSDELTWRDINRHLAGHSELADSTREILESCDARIAALEAKLARKDGALQYMADQSNWLEEDDFVKLKRPGGGRQEGIIMWSHDIRPWAYLRDFIKPAKEG